MAPTRRLSLVAALVVASIGCDQATKRVASALLERGVVYSWLHDSVRLQYAENRGAFLSLGAFLPEGARFWVFVVGVGLLLAAMLGFALVGRGLAPLEVAGFACFVGGGFSNWIDRVVNDGRVVDFMNLGIGRLRTGVFNVADVVLMAGVGLMLLHGWRRKPETPPGS